MKLLDQKLPRGLALDSLKQNYYGVEIELENWEGMTLSKYPDFGKYWNYVSDSSLRNGIEFVSKRCTQNMLKTALPVVQEVIKAYNLKSNSRCGIHVHVNMLNLTWGEYISFIALYTLLEPEIFAAFAPERHENHFCVPLYWSTRMANSVAADCRSIRGYNTTDIQWKRTTHRTPSPPKIQSVGDSITAWTTCRAHFVSTAQEFTPGTQPTDSGLAYGGGNNKRWYPLKNILTFPGKFKYAAMTAYRLTDLGTIEFRLLPGTTDTKKIMQWVKVLGRLKHEATKHPEPLSLQKKYESVGANAMWRLLKAGPRPAVSALDREAAEEGAFAIIGAPPRKKEDLNWNI